MWLKNIGGITHILALASHPKMATVRVKIQNPFARDYVVIDMPRDMKLADMQQVSDIAVKMAAELSGSNKVPESYARFPVNNVGRMALYLIAKTMPDRLANAQEGDFLMAMIASNMFLRQLLDRVGMKVMMERKLYVNSIIEFCKSSNPSFEDALRMRLPVLVQQAHDTVPPDFDRARRLAKLVEIAIKTLDDLPNLMGAEAYAAWKGADVAAATADAASVAADTVEEGQIEGASPSSDQYGEGDSDNEDKSETEQGSPASSEAASPEDVSPKEASPEEVSPKKASSAKSRPKHAKKEDSDKSESSDAEDVEEDDKALKRKKKTSRAIGSAPAAAAEPAEVDSDSDDDLTEAATDSDIGFDYSDEDDDEA